MGHELAYAACPGTISVVDAVSKMCDLHDEENGSHHHVRAAYNERGITILPGKFTKKTAYNAVSDGYERERNSSNNVFDDPTVAVRLYDETTISRRTVKVKVRFTGEQCDGRGPTFEFLDEYVKNAVGSTVTLKAGEFLEYWTVAAKEGGTQDIELTTKVVATASKEKSVTKYFVHLKGANPLDRHDAWEKRGFDSQAAARAAAIRFLESGQSTAYNAGVEYEITPVTRRESGAAVVNIKRTITKGVATLVLTMAKSSDPERHGGWAVGADCHH